MNHGEIVRFPWGVADPIRDTFKRGKGQDVILLLAVLRRLDGVLAGTEQRALAKPAELRGKTNLVASVAAGVPLSVASRPPGTGTACLPAGSRRSGEV